MPIEVVVGLGNPGERYAATRHNIAFRVVDEVARRHRVERWSARYSSHVARIEGERRLWLAKPVTYMNRCGTAAVELLQGLDLSPAGMLVISDDVDLALGRLRLRPSGGPGTHNGLRDVVDAIGPDFPRLRIGVGGEGEVEDLADYVLSPFTGAELESVAEVIARAADAVEMTINDGIAPAMNHFNVRTFEG